MNRFIIHDEKVSNVKQLGYSRWDFHVEDLETKQKQEIHFKWCGTDMRKTGTWDYAPLWEMHDIGDDSFDEFRVKLHQDEGYAEQQLIMNRRHDLWWEKHKTEKIIYETLTGNTPINLPVAINDPVEYDTKFDNYLIKCKDIDGTKFLFSASLLDKKIMTYPEWLINKTVYNILKQLDQNLAFGLVKKIAWKLRLNLSCDDIQMLKAHKRSEELLKEWLSEDELRWLVYQDELKIQYEDEIFIVKKNPSARVEVIKDGKTVESLCVITKDSGVAAGDALLSKIMMLKTNPVLFKKIATERRT